MEEIADAELLTEPDPGMAAPPKLDCEQVVESAEAWFNEDAGEERLPETAKKNIRREKKLVDRCVRGEVAAWEELYEEHHPPLLRSLAVLLGNRGSDRNLVDELAAQVWYSLVENDGELLGKFCPKRGARLNTFIRAVAKDVTSRYFRTEQRRRERELEAGRAAVENQHDQIDDLDDSLSEFLGTLSESERKFTEAYLLSTTGRDLEAEDDSPQRSDASIWQFSRRIRLKLTAFFGNRADRPS